MALRFKLPDNLLPPPTGAINRAPSPVLAYAVPWLTVALASAMTGWVTIAAMPLVPPLGLLMLVGWRQLHPGLLPVWAGLPLGLVDDLVSGQPVGSAVLLWSLAMLLLESIEARWPWRNFAIEWAVAAMVIVACLLGGAVIASGVRSLGWLPGVGVQAALSVLAYPLAGRAVAWCDRVRLAPLRKLG